MLTGKEIAERAIINGFEEKNIQQQGIDVRVNDISTFGHIPDVGKVLSNKTIIPKPEKMKCVMLDGVEGYMLDPGYYEVSFIEGCNIPDDCCLQFKTRSSVVRCGGEIRSGLFDAGFNTEHMGAFLKVEIPLFIEKHARVAQVIVDSSNKVDNLYNGQWQGDKQRQK